MSNKKSEAFATLRDFPSVEVFAGKPEFDPYVTSLSRPLVVEVIRVAIADAKETFQAGKKDVSEVSLLKAATAELDKLLLLHLVPVINGTGIIIHTNLGRAPLSTRMIHEAIEMATGYSNLEFSLSEGKRGKRGILVERLLALMCGTESGTIVNNNAAALFIILNTFAFRKEVIISRGELVQIGGGFRIPDIMRKSGVNLVEVGTTNRTSLEDYRDAVTDRTRMILKVHRSNFTQDGFVEETPLADLVDLCREHDLVLTHDLGSGLMSFPPEVEITDEPDVIGSVRAGADLTCFSGDKLLGGAQSGLIAGKKDLIAKIKKNPLFRTIRCDKLAFAINTQVFASYLRGTQFEDIPIWRMMTVPVSELKTRGEKIRAACGDQMIALVATGAFPGGGSTPGQTVPSLALVIRSAIKPASLARKFREYNPPIIGRIEEDDFLLDLRTIPPEKDAILIDAIREIVR